MKTILPAFSIRLGQFTHLALAVVLLTSAFFVPVPTRSALASTQIDIPGPPGSGAFGNVTVLPNGNFVVVDTGYAAPGPILAVGAVYLYNGATGVLISTLTGSTAGDKIGENGVVVLKNGNFVIISPDWDNGTAADSGAVTWGSVVTGVSGVVSAANSLVGSIEGSKVGSCAYSTCLTGLTNGNYVMLSTDWRNDDMSLVGAVTWGNGSTGVSGTISAANSLVGVNLNENTLETDFTPITELSNGNYVVVDPFWGNNGNYEVGAVTWGSGTTGVIGVVSAANSLVGSNSGDNVGCAGDFGGYGYVCRKNGVTALSNGNYVVTSPGWINNVGANVGAVTWGNGAKGVTGVISSANSLVGSQVGDNVGLCTYSPCVTPLVNGNYVVVSVHWSNGTAADAGAVTWGSGATGTTGVISSANSLVGPTTHDGVGGSGVTQLSNGNYVVRSLGWHNGSQAGVGAVTWGNGTTGIKGVVSPANSLVGSTEGDLVGSHGVWLLNNGNYLVVSARWTNGTAAHAGAVTWINGITGLKGTISPANSLVGSTSEDMVGNSGVLLLSNGNYVTGSNLWDNGSVINAGATTWGSATTGVKGVVSAANSLVGSTARDFLGSAIALKNGNYVVVSPLWDNGAVVDAGAAAWGNGATGTTGTVSAANSLVGTKTGDQVGYPLLALNNGNYVVASGHWHNGSAADAGAVTWGNGAIGTSGTVSADNSLVGSTAGDQVGVCDTTGSTICVTELSNGNYVVASPYWHNAAAANAGAVTWVNDASARSGVVSADNSLVGSTANDYIGCGHLNGAYCDTYGLIGFSTGDYVVQSSYWDNGSAIDVGALTFGSGIPCAITTRVGPVSAANSLIGTAAGGGEKMNFAYDPVHRQLVVGRPGDNTVSLMKLSGCAYNLYLPSIAK